MTGFVVQGHIFHNITIFTEFMIKQMQPWWA